jgi:hypothetical protein
MSPDLDLAVETLCGQGMHRNPGRARCSWDRAATCARTFRPRSSGCASAIRAFAIELRQAVGEDEAVLERIAAVAVEGL